MSNDFKACGKLSVPQKGTRFIWAGITRASRRAFKVFLSLPGVSFFFQKERNAVVRENINLKYKIEQRMIQNLTEKIFKYRWVAGFILIFFCTVFEVHGSSIGIYADILQHPELSDIILGKYRSIRSDEWLVFTPFAFSQYFNNFSMISEIVRGAATNLFVVYGQAVWNIAIIYRPAQIGYLFLDAGSGLAFFWMGRLIILFLVSFEFAQKILEVNKKLSLLYAIMVAFSPLAQWWWSVNSIAEILAATQGIIICWKLYLEGAETSKRFLSGLILLWCGGILIFSIYPAWQIPFAYVAIIGVIGVALNFSDVAKILWRDKFFWIIGVAVMAAPILHVLYISQDMIKLQMETEYPGQRFVTGGTLSISAFLFHSICPILPFKDIQEVTNNCEMATFYSMAPLGFIAAYIAARQTQILDKLTCAIIGLIIFFVIFEVAGFPAWLAKITLLSKVLDVRLKIAIDFLQLVLLFRSLKFIKEFPAPFKSLIIAEIIAVASAFAVYKFLPQWFFFGRGLFAVIFLTVTAFLFLTPMNKKTAAILAAMMLSMGVTVNPVNCGVNVIYKMPVGQKISEMVQGDSKSLWLVDSAGYLKDFPIMFGAPTINSVNVYPVLERWQKLDTNGENFKVYNRYAHIDVELKDAPTEFILLGADHFDLKLNFADLPKLNVKYILSPKSDLPFDKIYEDAGIFIYEIRQ